MRSGSPNCSALRLETLEARDLPAGNVAANLIGGDLLVRGDRADNSILIQLNRDGNLEVRGADGTTVNYGTAVIFEGVSAVPDDLRIFMRGGADQVLIDRVTVQDDLFVSMGHGDDAILIERSAIGDDATVLTGNGRDRIAVADSVVEDRFFLSAGRGNDLAFLDPTAINGKTTVLMGSGNDVVRVHGANAPGGHDFGSRAHFIGGGGYDLIEMDVAKGFASSPRILGFEANNQVDVAELSPAEGVAIANFPPPFPAPEGSRDFGINEEGTITELGRGVVNFSGGQVEFLGVSPFYASAPASYVTDDGAIDFAVPVQSVSFFFVGVSGNAAATAYDETGQAIGTVSANTPTFLADPGNFVSFRSNRGIARIVIEGGLAKIDNVAFVRPPQILFSPAEGLQIRNLNDPSSPPGSREFSLLGAKFSGGEVATIGFLPAYASPPASYLLTEATIRFKKPVSSVRFFFVHLAGQHSTATAYDRFGNVVATATSNDPTSLGDPANFVRLTGGRITRIELSGGLAAVDNVSFFPH